MAYLPEAGKSDAFDHDTAPKSVALTSSEAKGVPTTKSVRKVTWTSNVFDVDRNASLARSVAARRTASGLSVGHTSTIASLAMATRSSRKETLKFEAAFEPGRPLRVLGLVLLMIGVPLSMATRVVAFKAVASEKTSVMAPLMFGSLGLAACISIGITVLHGFRELGGLFRAKYALMVLPGVLNASIFAFSNVALGSGLSGTDLRLVMKVGIALNVVAEMWITRKAPYATQVLTIVAILIALLLFGRLGASAEPAGLGAWLFGAAAAVSTSLFGCVFEAVSRNSSENRAEPLRLALVLELWKAVALAALLVATEPEFLGPNMFRGWDWRFVLGAVATTPLQIVFCNSAIVMVGALRQQVVAALDLPLTYVMESFLGGGILVDKVLAIVVITLLVVAYMLFSIEVRKAVARALAESVEPSFA